MKNNWKQFKLGELCEITSSKRIFSKEYRKEGIPFYRGKEIIQKSNGDKISNELFIETSRYEEIKCKFGIPSSGDILMTAVGTLGIPYIVRDEEFYFKDGNLVWIKNFNKIHSEYLYFWLKSDIGQNKIHQFNIGSTQKAITIDSLNKFDIILPSLETQKKITKILSDIDNKIEINNKINDNLEAQAQAIFKSWFVDFEPFGGVMPSDWEIATLEDVASEIICGKTPSTKNKDNYGVDIPFITIPDMHNQTYITTTERYLSVDGANTQKNKFLPVNSICVSCIATAGLVALTSECSQTNQQINSIIPKKDVSPYYVYLTMKSLSEHIKMLGSSGSTTNNLNKAQFSKIEIILPTNDIMKKFDNVVANIFKNNVNINLENQKLAQLCDTLLPRLMSGEIDVSQVEI